MHPSAAEVFEQEARIVAREVTTRFCAQSVVARRDQDGIEAAALVGCWRAASVWQPERGLAIRSMMAWYAHNAIVDWLREFGGRPPLRCNPQAGSRLCQRRLTHQPVAPHTPLDELTAREIEDSITRLLSGRSRRLLHLLIIEGLTMREAGEEMQLSESRISQRWKQILTRLRQCLGQKATF